MIRARSSLLHRLAAAGVVALAGLALAGCSATNEITTAKAYSASDGVRAVLGDITAENLIVLTSAQGAPAALQGAFTNRGTAAITVSITSGTVAIGTVRVDPATTVLVGGDTGKKITFTADNAPGGVTPLTLATGPGGSLTVSVPVLDGTLPEYATLVPTPTAS
ncbi:MAG TPA: hypothetical protein VFW79_04990 [Cellulomonas sp.]|uniref:hypothetical protein n=1 Tax=Cellulomonas sp. TaxID=40001 RepID=UPI002E3803F4|nr:hypothetical protein [Cellulomonas sp.]HEX5331980.1 hypothetical protein [Cellulomonas sp.]